MAEKILKRVNEGHISVWDLCGHIDSAINILKSYKDSLTQKGYTSICLDWSALDDEIKFNINVERLETDKEFEQRLKKEEKEKIRKNQDKLINETKEKKELIRLLKKHGVPTECQRT